MSRPWPPKSPSGPEISPEEGASGLSISSDLSESSGLSVLSDLSIGVVSSSLGLFCIELATK